MRLHPAVATALVLVGGALIWLAVSEGFRAPGRSAGADSPPTAFAAFLVSCTLGVAFVLAGVVLSFDSRPTHRGPAGPPPADQ